MGSASTTSPFHLPLTEVLCQTSPVKNLSVTICLTIALLLGSAGMSWSADFQKGLDANGYDNGYVNSVEI